MKIGEFQIAPMDRAAALEAIAWRYPPPYDLYNISAEHADETLDAFLDPTFCYYQMRDIAGELAAFFNFGVDACVRGGDYGQEALDIGLGVHPARTGQGRGASYVRAVLAYARATVHPALYRVTIAAFNQRARHLWEKAGFSEVQQFQRPLDAMPFVILTASDPAI